MRSRSPTVSCSRSNLGTFLHCCSRRYVLHFGICWMQVQSAPGQSPWCNAMVLVRKKDGMLCFCVDFHRLNVHTKKDSYPLPWIQEVLESMAGAAHFSMVDFKSGFWQVRMALESQQYTAFTVGNLGFTSSLVCPLGSVMCQPPSNA